MKNAYHISTKQHGGHEIGRRAIQMTQPSRKQCVLVHSLVGKCTSKAISTNV